MYYINKKLNLLCALLCQILYAYLGYKISLEYKHNNIIEFLIGILLTTLIMNILELIFRQLAYGLTGKMSSAFDYDSTRRKAIHWIIRVLLISTVYILSETPLCSIILTPLVQYCTSEFLECFSNITAEITNTLVSSIESLYQ